MKTKELGDRGETIASVFLTKNGFEVVDRNWKTRWCEIDIIAKQESVVYFVEVKYRKNGTYGDGLDYITIKKQGQMQFAAEFWVHAHKYSGDYRLAAISVTGDQIQFIDEL